jgi:hypothetical protein
LRSGNTHCATMVLHAPVPGVQLRGVLLLLLLVMVVLVETVMSLALMEGKLKSALEREVALESRGHRALLRSSLGVVAEGVKESRGGWSRSVYSVACPPPQQAFSICNRTHRNS